MAHCDPRARRALAALGLLLAAATWMPRALAQPSVRVRATTQLVLETRRSERGLEIQGALLDDLGVPLRQRSIELVVGGDGVRQKEALRTSEDGGFRASFEWPPGRSRVLVSFAGDTAYTASEQTRDVDRGQVDVRLRFVEPHALRVDLDRAPCVIVLRADSALGGAGLDVRLQDERGRELARGPTDADAAFRVLLPPDELGPAGIGRLVARTAGDARRSPAQAELEVLRFRNTSLALRAKADSDRGRIALAGSLRDSHGGIANKAIGLFDGDRHLATVWSARDGSFHHVAPMPTAGEDRAALLDLQARFESDAPWIGSSRSPVAALHVRASAPPNTLWLLVPLAMCGISLWLLTRRELRDRDELRDRAQQRGPGFHPARRRQSHGPERTHVSGQVVDTQSGRAILAATASLELTGRRIDLTTDAAGCFDSGELAAGTWKLRVQAAGYAGLTSSVVIPHRGEWSDVQVSLASLRSAAVVAYRPAATRALPSRELWDSWTPRETLDNAERNGYAPASFVQLTDYVERAAYARDSPTESDVAEIERTATTAIAEMPCVSDDEGQSLSRNNSALLRARIPHHR